MFDSNIAINTTTCLACGNCASVCPKNAIVM